MKNSKVNSCVWELLVPVFCFFFFLREGKEGEAESFLFLLRSDNEAKLSHKLGDRWSLVFGIARGVFSSVELGTADQILCLSVAV